MFYLKAAAQWEYLTAIHWEPHDFFLFDFVKQCRCCDYETDKLFLRIKGLFSEFGAWVVNRNLDLEQARPHDRSGLFLAESISENDWFVLGNISY